MLRGKGKAREQWKTTTGLISKKATLRVQHTFLYISLLLFCMTTIWNFQKLLSYMFYGGNVICVIVHFFFTAAHFHLALVAASISHFLTTSKKFSCCFPNKKMTPLFFISRSRSPLPFFWMTFADLLPTFSFSLSLSFSIFQISGHDN